MPKFLFIGMLSLWFAVRLNAQNKKVEELKLRLANANEDTLRVITMYKLCAHIGMTGDYKEALRYGNKAINLGEAIHYVSGLAGAYSNVGIIYYYQGNLSEAVKYYLLGLKYAEQAKNKESMANALMNVGVIYAEQNEYDKATNYFTEAINLAKEFTNPRIMCDAYSNLSYIYVAQGNYFKALTTDSIVLKLVTQIDDKELIMYANNDIADIYLKQKKYDAALQCNFKALEIAEHIQHKDGSGIAINNIGKIYLKQDKIKEAITYLNKALDLSKEIGNLNLMSESYQYLAEAYTALGKPTEALFNYKKYILYRDSIYNNENTKKITQNQMQFDFDKKETAIKAKQAIKDALAKQEIQKQKIVILAVVLGSGVVILIMLLIINKRKAKHNLQVNKLENKTLRSQLNPHFIFNALASIKNYMDAHPTLARNYLTKFGKLMREVLENSEKEYISLEDEFSMLKNYMDLENLRVKNGFDYEFIVDENTDEETIQVPPLLFQPIIENAIWHGVANGSSKGKIIISVKQIDDALKIEIENHNYETNLGLSENKEEVLKKKSFGLQIVRERLQLLSKEKNRKGTIELCPKENGMNVTIEIPI